MNSGFVADKKALNFFLHSSIYRIEDAV